MYERQQNSHCSKQNIPENIIIKTYYGRVPACGVFAVAVPLIHETRIPV